MSTIYIVDDDGLLREMLTRFLVRENQTVASFASPLEAMSSLAETPPDLIISDVQMPEKNGLEFVQELRDRGQQVPVVLITGHLTDEVTRRAHSLGVSQVFEKPLKDLPAFWHATRHALRATTGGELNRIHVDFLTGLSHDIRTPLTAVKLALDGLFSGECSACSPPQRKLLSVSRRNVDRLISVVEKRLDLLQITLGEVSIARRLTALGPMVERVLSLSAGGANGDHVTPREDDGIFLFTDPERLQAVIHYVLERRGDPRSPGHIHHRLSDGGDAVMLEIQGTAVPTIQQPANGDGVEFPSSIEPSDDFEFRACCRLVELLGGTVTVTASDTEESVRIELPLVPPYNRRSDFIVPIKRLRKAAKLNEKGVSFLKCELSAQTGDRGDHELRNAVLRRCMTSLSEGDILVRGRNERVFYLVLLERKADEIEHIRRFVEGGGEPLDEIGGPVRTVLLQTILPGDAYPKDLLMDLEAVN